VKGEGEIRIRVAEDRDLESLLTVHAAAFPDPRGREARRKNFCENPRGSLSDLYVAERGGRVVGHGFLFPMRSWFGGPALSVGGVASVGVAPDARRSRVGRALLVGLLAQMRARGMAVSMLYPFRHDFYRKLGWGLVGELRRHRFRPDALPLFEERERVLEGRPDHLDAVRECYETFAKTRTGLLARSDAVWASLVRSETVRIAQVPRAGGDLEGYCLYRFVADPMLSHQEIEVHELVANTPSARLALWGFLSAQRDQVRRIQMSVPPDEPLHLFLREPRGPEEDPIRGLTFVAGQVAVGLMLRIVDPARAIAGRGWSSDGEVVLNCPDRLLGDGTRLRLVVRGGHAEVGAAASGAGPVLAMDPSTFAQVWSGALLPSRAVYFGLAQVEPGSALPWLDRLFALPPPATLDVF
jgi:predicted acetyltransferase